MNRDILIYAFRYALGRQSIAPSIVVDYIMENIDDIPKGDLEIIKKEILEAIEKGNAGSSIDVDTWKKLIN